MSSTEETEVDWEVVQQFASKLPQDIGGKMDSAKWNVLYEEAASLKGPTSVYVDEMLLLYKPAQKQTST